MCRVIHDQKPCLYRDIENCTGIPELLNRNDEKLPAQLLQTIIKLVNFLFLGRIAISYY